MKIAYCTNVRLPSERAHGHQIAQVCDALANLGHTVTIFCPYRDNIISEDYWKYYGARRDVSLKVLGTFDAIRSTFLPGVLGLLWMNASLRKHLSKELSAQQFDLAYTRTPALLSELLASGIPTILELHQLPNRSRHLFVRECNQCKVVACLTSAMRSALIEWGVDPSKVIVAGDAVDLGRFKELPSAEEARKALGIDTKRLVVGYVGRLKTLSMEKGVGVLLKALAAELRSANGELRKNENNNSQLATRNSPFFGLIVGGPEGDQRAYQTLANELGLSDADVHFTGEIPASDVPKALAACDILAMPFPDLPHYRLHMSPLKMFEYMAAGRPIITTDLPTIRDVLSEETAVFCRPGSEQSLANALNWISEHKDEAQGRAQKAQELVKQHTWEVRMKRILEA